MSIKSRMLNLKKSKPLVQCGKKKYDQARAKLVAKDDRKSTGQYIVPYRCDDCGFYHVGHYHKPATDRGTKP